MTTLHEILAALPFPRRVRIQSPLMLFTPDLIAPCGMNCGLCSAYLAFSHNIPKKRGKITHCAGCRARPKMCAWLKGNCDQLATGKIQFCYECADFPCDRLSHIDHRYQTSYNTSFIRNLEEIRDHGMNVFLKNQTKRYMCRRCEVDVISVHKGKCYRCDTVKSWKASKTAKGRGGERDRGCKKR